MNANEISHEQTQEAMTQVASVVGSYYVGLVKEGVPAEIAEGLASSFQERFLDVVMGLFEREVVKDAD